MNTSLTEIGLQNNKIGDEGGKAIGRIESEYLVDRD